MNQPGLFWQPRVPARAAGISAVALTVPLIAQLFFPESAREYQLLLWLLPLIPAFLLAYYRGWRGAATALALGMAALASVQAVIAARASLDPDRPAALLALGAFAFITLGVGWLSELLHRQRVLAEKNAMELVTLLNAQGVIVYESPAVERMLGYRPEELVGRPVREFVHPEDADEAAPLLGGGTPAPGGTASAEFRFRHKDGSWRILHAQGRNLLHDRRVGGVLVSSREITERRRLEEQLRQAQKMEALGRLAGGVAHDFNNMLTAIKGYAEILMDGLGKDHPLRAEVAGILRTVDHGSGLIRQLMAVSRRQVLHPKVLDLNGAVRGIEPMLRRLLGSSFALTVALDPDLPRIHADPSQVEQVIMNLVLNARDAMPDGGPIVLSTRAIEAEDGADQLLPTGLPAGRYAVLAVTDTGTGMDAETARRIFEPFFTTKEKGKGTGLGLSTVYGIVQQSGGQIMVQSEPARGSTFSVYLPAVEE